MGDIIIVGTFHPNALTERDKIIEIIEKESPDAICVEATWDELEAYRKMEFDDVHRGLDIWTAIKTADEHNIDLYAIDSIVKYNMYKLADGILSELNPVRVLGRKSVIMFMLRGTLKRLPHAIEFALSDTDGFIDTLFNEMPRLQRKFIRDLSPPIGLWLYDERERHMCEKLMKRTQTYDKIICVIGAGHVDAVGSVLEKKGLTPRYVNLINECF